MCPECWSGKYKKEHQGEFPDGLGAPAVPALLNAEIFTLKELSGWSEKELLALHGMGPSSIPKLREALEEKGLGFKDAR